MISKMSKTELSAKILKRKKIKVFIIRITPKAFQHMSRMNKTEISAKILKRKKNHSFY